MKWFKDITGRKFGRLMALKCIGSTNKGGAIWECVCICGNIKITRGSYLRSSIVRSCGCLHREKSRERARILGRSQIGQRKTKYGETACKATYRRYKKEANERSLDFDLSLEEFKKIVRGNCYICSKVPSNVCRHDMYFGEFVYSGLDRVDSTKGYTRDNVMPCCWRCNRIKKKLSLDEFKNFIKMAYNNLVLEG